MVAGVMVLSGGEVLLSGAAVADVARALRLAARVAARDGIGVSAGMRALLAAVNEAEARASAAVGTPEVPGTPDAALSLLPDEVTTTTAARMLGTTDRNVRDLCSRGTLATARKIGASWVVDRAEIIARREDTP